MTSSHAAYVTQPSIVLGEHTVSLQEIEDDFALAHAGDRRLPVWQRQIRSTGVHQRHFARPLAEVSAPNQKIEQRSEATFTDVCRLGVQSLKLALAASGLDPKDIDCLITASATGAKMPGLDVHLINELKMRPTVRRIPIAQLGCAGGAFALALASEYLRARPGERVAVVCSEVPSATYQHSEMSVGPVIFKALFGDGAGAAIVTSQPLGPGIRIEDTMELTLPNSTTRYWMEPREDGYHFLSTREALNSTNDALPHILPWWHRNGDESIDFAVVHPGGLRVLDDVQKGLDLKPELLRHSHESMAENGNLAGVAILDVLARQLQTPPHDGTRGLLLGFGPGFTAIAGEVTAVR